MLVLVLVLVACADPSTDPPEGWPFSREEWFNAIAQRDRDWQNARTDDTIPAYLDFIGTYRPSGWSPSLRATAEPATLRAARLRVNELYAANLSRLPERSRQLGPVVVRPVTLPPDVHVTLPLELLVRNVLSYAGLHVVTNPPTVTAFPAVAVTVNGKADGAAYGDLTYCLTGAEIAGDIAMSMPDGRGCIKSFRGVIEPPDRASIPCCKSLSCAPYQAALEKSLYVERLVDVIGDCLGDSFLTQLLRDRHHDVRVQAMRRLSATQDHRAVPALIDSSIGVGTLMPLEGAARAAFDIAGLSVVDSLWQRLNTEQVTSRRVNVVRALAEIPDHVVVGKLIEAMGDVTYEVAEAAESRLIVVTHMSIKDRGQLPTPNPTPAEGASFSYVQSHDQKAWSAWWSGAATSFKFEGAAK